MHTCKLLSKILCGDGVPFPVLSIFKQLKDGRLDAVVVIRMKQQQSAFPILN